MIIFGIILAAIAAVLLLVAVATKNTSRKYGHGPSRPAGIAAGVTALLAIVALAFSFVYTQGVGEAKVLKSWTGEVVGQDVTPGLGTKSAFTKVVNFDIRNQQAAYKSDGKGDNITGPQITVTDKDGVRSDVDVTVLYSIDPEAVSDIYNEHQNQDTFKSRVVEQDIRSVVRTVPGKFTTQQLLNDRSGVELAVSEALTARWAEQGILLESVALQEVRPPAEVLSRYADAQAAQAEVVKEEARLKATEVSAQQKIVQANAEAEANRIINASLTDKVLELRHQDMLRAIGEKGNLVVVPEGSTPLVQTPQK